MCSHFRNLKNKHLPYLLTTCNFVLTKKCSLTGNVYSSMLRLPRQAISVAALTFWNKVLLSLLLFCVLCIYFFYWTIFYIPLNATFAVRFLSFATINKPLHWRCPINVKWNWVSREVRIYINGVKKQPMVIFSIASFIWYLMIFE